MRFRGVCLVGAAISAMALGPQALAAAPRGPGDVDRSFGAKGRLTTSWPASFLTSLHTGPRPGGGLLVAALPSPPSAARNVFAFTRAGRPDHRFGGNGVTVFGTGATVVTTAGGATLAGRALPEGFELRRLTPSGGPDEAFGNHGTAVVSLGGRRTPGALTVAADGRIVVVATADPPGGSLAVADRLSVTRLLPDGRLDRGFARDGEHLSAAAASPVQVATEPGGRITVLAFASAAEVAHPEHVTTLLLRITPDGAADTGFGGPHLPGGLYIPNGYPSSEDRMAVDGRGRPVLARTASPGTSSARLRVQRLTAAGQADAGFGHSGGVALDLGPRTTSAASDVDLDGAGRILVSGSRGSVREPELDRARPLVARLLADGRRDRTFGRSGVVVGRPGAAWSSVLVQGSRVVLAGVRVSGPPRGVTYTATRLIGGSDRAAPRIGARRSCRTGRLTVRVRDAAPLARVRYRLDSGRVASTRRGTIHLRPSARAHRLVVRAADIAGNRSSRSFRVRRC